MYQIVKYCKIRNNSVVVDGINVLKTSESPGTSKQFKEIYSSLQLTYPKFFKMDMLSKLAFLAAEYLVRDISQKLNETETAIFLSNKNSTIDVDKKYLETIGDDNYFPNPALFVYTLPNVMIGEISIRHNLKGETLFAQVPLFCGETIEKYLKAMSFENCIAGFVEYENENNFEAILAFIERNEKSSNIVLSQEFDRLHNSYEGE